MVLNWCCIPFDKILNVLFGSITNTVYVSVPAMFMIKPSLSLQWRHNGRDGVSNHQPRHCLLNRLFRLRSKKTSSSLALVWVINGWPVNSPHKWPVTRKMFPFDDVIKYISKHSSKWAGSIAKRHFKWTCRGSCYGLFCINMITRITNPRKSRPQA